MVALLFVGSDADFILSCAIFVMDPPLMCRGKTNRYKCKIYPGTDIFVWRHTEYKLLLMI